MILYNTNNNIERNIHFTQNCGCHGPFIVNHSIWRNALTVETLHYLPEIRQGVWAIISSKASQNQSLISISRFSDRTRKYVWPHWNITWITSWEDQKQAKENGERIRSGRGQQQSSMLARSSANYFFLPLPFAAAGAGLALPFVAAAPEAFPDCDHVCLVGAVIFVFFVFLILACIVRNKIVTSRSITYVDWSPSASPSSLRLRFPSFVVVPFPFWTLREFSVATCNFLGDGGREGPAWVCPVSLLLASNMRNNSELNGPSLTLMAQDHVVHCSQKSFLLPQLSHSLGFSQRWNPHSPTARHSHLACPSPWVSPWVEECLPYDPWWTPTLLDSPTSFFASVAIIV